MSAKFGVTIPMAEAMVQELGEAKAWLMAQEQADHLARKQSRSLVRIRSNSYSQNFPMTDPETGEEMEPIRCYLFTYVEADDA